MKTYLINGEPLEVLPEEEEDFLAEAKEKNIKPVLKNEELGNQPSSTKDATVEQNTTASTQEVDQPQNNQLKKWSWLNKDLKLDLDTGEVIKSTESKLDPTSLASLKNNISTQAEELLGLKKISEENDYENKLNNFKTISSDYESQLNTLEQEMKKISEGEYNNQVEYDLANLNLKHKKQDYNKIRKEYNNIIDPYKALNDEYNELINNYSSKHLIFNNNLESYNQQIPTDSLEPEIAPWQSFKNSLSNALGQADDTFDFWGLTMGGKTIEEAAEDGTLSSARSSLNIASTLIWEGAFGRETLKRWKEKNPNFWKTHMPSDSETFVKMIEGFQEEKQEKTLPTMTFKQADSFGDYLSVASGAVASGGGSVVYNLGTAFSGFFMDFAADNFIEANKVKAEEKGKTLGQLIKDDEADVATPIKIAGLQAGLEMIPIFKLFKPIGKNANKLLGKKLTGNYAYNKNIRMGLDMFSVGGTEMVTESAQHGLGHYNKQLAIAKAKGIDLEADNIFGDNALGVVVDGMLSPEGVEAGLQGFFAGTGLRGGTYSAKTLSQIRQSVNDGDIENDLSNLVNLTKEFNDSTDDVVKAGLNSKIEDLKININDKIKNGNDIYQSLSEGDISKIEKLGDLADVAAFRTTELNKKLDRGEISKETHAAALEGLSNKYKDSRKKIKTIIKNATVKEQVQKFSERTGREGKVTSMTSEEISNIKEKGFDSKSAATSFGFIKQQINGDFEIVLNKDKAMEGTAAHEFMHAVLFKTLNNNKKLQTNLGNALEEHVVTLGGDLSGVGKRLTAYGDWVENKNGEVEFIKDDNFGEETIAIMSESILDGTLRFDEGFFTKIGDVVRRFGQNYLNHEVRFDTGRDVYNFIKDYNNSIETGKVNEAIVRVAKEGAKGRLVGDKTKAAQSTAQMSKDAKPQVDELGRMGWTAKTWKDTGADFAIEDMQANSALDRLIASKLKVPMSIARTKEFVQKVYAELTPHAKNFNPEVNDSFFGWINSQIANKAGNVYNREYKVEQRTQDIDARTEEGTPMIQVEADTQAEMDFIDQIGLTEEQQVEYSKLRKKLKLDDSMISKVRNAVVKTFGTKLPDIESKKFRSELEKRYRTELKKPIQDMIGTRENYTKFLKNNFESVYNALPVGTLVQIERNLKPEQRIFTTSKRITKSTEVDKLISEGRLPKDTNRTSGPQLHTKNKYPGEDKVLAFFRGVDMKKKLGYEVGGSTLGTRKDKLAMEIGVELAFDATSETIQQPEVLEKRIGILELEGKDQKQNELAIIAKQIDRDPTVKFSKDKLVEQTDFLENLVSELGIENVIKDGKLLEGLPIMSKAAIQTVQKLYDKNITLSEPAKAFKQGIFKSNIVPTRIKNGYKAVGNLRYNTPELDRMHVGASAVALKLGPEIMDVTGYDFLGYTNRTMDSADRKEKPFWKNLNKNERKKLTDKHGKDYRFQRNTDGSFVTGPYNSKLNKTKEKVNKNPVKLPPGLILEDVRVMNKILPLFQKIEKILALKSKKEKLEKLKALQPEIDAANIANIKLAKHIAKTIIELTRLGPKKGGINAITALNILQSQTSIVKGFRGLSRLDLIDVREGSQSVSEAHPQYKQALKYYKNKGVKNPETKALERVGSKGEHLAPNSNTMKAIAELIFKKDVDIDTELDLIFADHSQLLTSKFTTDVIDDGPGGKTSTANFDRIKHLKQSDINNIVSAEGRSYQDVLGDAVIRSMQMKGFSEARFQLSKAFDLRKAQDNIYKFSKDNKARGMSTFDFDETLIIDGKNFVVAKNPKTREQIKVNSAQWPTKGPELAAQGYEFNFDDFVNVRGGIDGPLLQKMKNQIKKYGPENVFVLTARPQEAATAIDGWLKSKGVNIPSKNITGLADSRGQAKADWMLEKFAEGYNDMYFVDDALPNVKAVKNVLEQLDIKSKVVQAKIKFSKSAPLDFDKILEQSKGVVAGKRFSVAEARKRGLSKGRFKFFIPPSAEDFKGLLYSFLGKGKEGDTHMKFFKDNLLDPFAKGYREWNTYKQAMADDYAELKKQSPNVSKILNKNVKGTSFTNDSAARVYLWDKAGFEIPGISKTLQDKLVKQVNSNPELKSFADALSAISRRPEGYVEPSSYWTAQTIGSDLNNIVGRVGRKEFLSEWINNKDIIFNADNLNKIEAIYGNGFRDALENMLYRMENGTNRITGKDKTVNKFLNWINGSVGATMFWNMRSAILQTISTVNFINWADNNVFKASTAFANQPQFWKDFSFIFNSPMLKQRRAGLQIDVSASELTRAFADGRSKPEAIIAYLLEKGFTPTKIADSFAIAMGGSTFYRNRLNTYIKQGMSDTKAKEQAWLDFQEIAEETQQSSRPDLISMQQAGVLGRIILAWQNTPMQMTRLTKKAMSDLVNRRGSDKANISRIIYYGVAQNIIFGALQTGLMFMLFGNDEDEEKKKKMELRVANGAFDTLLRGTGVYGAAIATLKNVLLKWRDERKKGWNRDDMNIAQEIINLSPPMGSKMRKIMNAVRTEKYNKGVSEKIGLRIENPNFSIATNLTEGLTNIPVARVLNKANNIEEALTGNHELWQRVALASGWSRWSIGVKDEELEQAKIEAKEDRRIKREELKAKKKTEEKKLKDEEKEKVEEKKKEEGIKKVRCSAIKSNGQRCNMTVETKAKTVKCVYHKTYTEEEEKKGTDRDGDGKREFRCTATKGNGERCKNRTENKNKKCYAHQ